MCAHIFISIHVYARVYPISSASLDTVEVEASCAAQARATRDGRIFEGEVVESADNSEMLVTGCRSKCWQQSLRWLRRASAAGQYKALVTVNMKDTGAILGVGKGYFTEIILWPDQSPYVGSMSVGLTIAPAREVMIRPLQPSVSPKTQAPNSPQATDRKLGNSDDLLPGTTPLVFTWQHPRNHSGSTHSAFASCPVWQLRPTLADSGLLPHCASRRLSSPGSLRRRHAAFAWTCTAATLGHLADSELYMSSF